MDLYYAYSDKTNIVNSAFLVVFDKIFKENKKDLIMHIVSLYITFQCLTMSLGRVLCRVDPVSEPPEVFQKNSDEVRSV